ncbi:FAD-dependent oxidoreductase [Puniceicoccus vermicola]|uniref:FAD-dependent oxidoreductase n=1 Tax=Puniceicoccus vermicola TaxID=388746 RepID=A0A7X1AZ21_9BACT|nr:FAD-dependent oxidoreductase [Puniceicoccus vermicola]MBC2602564.1 FAD-dependent oxidoreductase [Puniceicoccus vermicola]
MNNLQEKKKIVECDVAIIGGGFGAIAAAQACLERGLRVVISEQYPWVGGQATSQALCVLDEYHDPISEAGVGYSRRYGGFRQSLRKHYQEGYRLSEFGRDQLYFNAGNSMNSMVVAEPPAALKVIEDLFEKSGGKDRLTIFTNYVPTDAVVENRLIQSVTCDSDSPNQPSLEIVASFFLNGDETGELFPILNLPFLIGAEAKSEFQEPHAPDDAAPDSVQSFTYCIAAEFVPGGSFVISKPDDYEFWKEKHGDYFYLDAPGARADDPALMFSAKKGRNDLPIPPAFYYRCMVDRANFDDPRLPYSRTIFNVTGNDYYHENAIGKEDRQEIYGRARSLAKSYLYWLQTEAPRDEGGYGYPELRPMPELTGAPDGIAMAPYIREGRRLRACQIVTENDISTATAKEARGSHFRDSVGLGCFIIDIHRRNGAPSLSQMSRPYQIPLGALLSPELDNFAVAGKSIGVTQIANGAYRLHNVEWAVGEAAGEFAAYALEEEISSQQIGGEQLKEFQSRLVKAGVPLCWFEDVSFDDPAFEAIQLLSVCKLLPMSREHLRFNPYYSVARSRKLADFVFDRLDEYGVDYGSLRRKVVEIHCTRFAQLLIHVYRLLERQKWPEPLLRATNQPDGDVESLLFNDVIPEGMDETDKHAYKA